MRYHKTIVRAFLTVYLLMMVLLPAAIFAGSMHDYDRVIDRAGLLSQDEWQKLDATLADISEAWSFDVIIVTVTGLDGIDPQTGADELYDRGGYGYGSSHDGILLLLSMQDRKWAISTTGFGITAFTDEGQAYMVSQFRPYLSDGEYYEGFNCFAGLCRDFLEEASEGSPYDTDHMPSEPLPWYAYLGSLLGGGGVAGLVTFGLKSQLKSVRLRQTADEYIERGSVDIRRREDVFLYSHVTRVPKPKNNTRGGGGGSSTHTGPSGTTHGGSSGSF
ncbi:MAG: TPM domain-containing protein [Blautia sp.]|nr:TPM domain-containing protein [Blautia sp.]